MAGWDIWNYQKNSIRTANKRTQLFDKCLFHSLYVDQLFLLATLSISSRLFLLIRQTHQFSSCTFSIAAALFLLNKNLPACYHTKLDCTVHLKFCFPEKKREKYFHPFLRSLRQMQSLINGLSNMLENELCWCASGIFCLKSLIFFQFKRITV